MRYVAVDGTDHKDIPVAPHRCRHPELPLEDRCELLFRVEGTGNARDASTRLQPFPVPYFQSVLR